ncbi:MAG: two-component sensor histidine kinase [Melioribacteraceae bacterium]|nr:two-component sensor histidine kinase [Melioribacteraceae bacterium]
MFKKIKENYYSARIFSPVIFSITALYLLLIISVSLFSEFNLIFLLVTSFLFVSLLQIMIGRKRKNELNAIKNVISRIRKNEIEKPSDIELSKNLEELEDEIQAMFFRTQSDIANLKKLEQVRTEFLGNVSHELRTPIFAIQGFIETLLDGAINNPKVNINFLEKAKNHTLNLNNLLNDLIDISMIESGQMKLSYRYFNIFELIDSMVHEFKSNAENKGLELILDTFDRNMQLYGDKQRIRQVLSNLLTNAIKYTENGFVKVGVEELPYSGRVYVQDTGLGISEHDRPRVFERFYRIDRDRSREMGGTGLGLAIVKHILEAHSSKIELNSKIGVGSEFYFYLKK